MFFDLGKDTYFCGENRYAMRYFVELSYRGTRYNGWQKQPGAPSVQQTLEEALSTLLGRPVAVTGAGRTDTGVHAEYYVAHFDTPQAICETDTFLHHLNAILSADIAVASVMRVADGAHARFDARSREYRYYIRDRKSPFFCDLEWEYYVELDIDAMNRAAALLPAQSDFTTFSKLHSGNKTNICKVFEASWQRMEGMSVFTIRADRFLRNMVRSLVAAMVDVGRGKTSVNDFADILSSLDRSRATGTAPAHGLYMSDVTYPPEVFTRSAER